MEADHYFKYMNFLKDTSEEEAPVVKFGWVEAVKDDIDFSKPIIYSYHSRSKFATDEDKIWSKKAETNIISFDDYVKFFKSLTGESPESFLEKWSSSEEELKAYWSERLSTDKDQDVFLYKLARLLVEGKKFVMYSRGFKLIEPEKEDDEDKDKA